MAYNTQNFEAGQVLTASALNTMDNQIQANEQAVEGINNTLVNIDNRTMNIENTTNNIYSYLMGDVMNKLNELSNNSGGSAGETTGGIESRFLNELGYAMPNILNSAVNTGIELQNLMMSGNSWINIFRPAFIPSGMDFTQIQGIGNTENILTWTTGYSMPNYMEDRFHLRNVMGNVILGDMGTTPKVISFSPLTESVSFTSTYYVKNDFDGQTFLFNYCPSLHSIYGLEMVDTSNVQYFSYSFAGCNGLVEIGGIANWNTANCLGMNSMFDGCSSVTSLDISGWNTDNVQNMNSMFSNCSNLSNLVLPNEFGKNVQNASNLFSNSWNLTDINISNMNPNVSEVQNMFQNCSNLTTISLPEHFGQNAFDLGGIFGNCTQLQTVNGSIDVGNAFHLGWTEGIFHKLEWSDGITTSTQYNKIRYIVLHNIGKYNSGMEGEAIDIYAPYWGIDNPQCVIDSLVNYSYDRASAGYPTLTIHLHSNAGIVLSEDNINTLTNKGYTVNIIPIDNIGM